jgi:hypothetical protein
MKAAVTISMNAAAGALPELVNILASSGLEIRSLASGATDGTYTAISLRAVSEDLSRLRYALNLIKGSPEKFRDVTVRNEIDDAIDSGILSLRGTLPVTDAGEYEMNIQGCAEILAERIADSDNPAALTGIPRCFAYLSMLRRRKEGDRQFFLRYSAAETDAAATVALIGCNAFPLVLEYDILEDLLRALKSLERNFAVFRILNIDDEDDLQLLGMTGDALGIPVVSRQYDELPPFVLAGASKMLTAHSQKIPESNIGIIGLDATALRTAGLLMKSGCRRVLGYDSSEKRMLQFERAGGLATTPENIFSNCDLVVVMKPVFTEDDLARMRPNLLVLSLVEDDAVNNLIVARKACKELVQGWRFDTTLIYPHLLQAVARHQTGGLTDAVLMALAQQLEKKMSKGCVLPAPTGQEGKAIIDAIFI